MEINFTHDENIHTRKGALCALPKLFPGGMPRSILDVGCGVGTWLSAAKQLGVDDYLGIDGVNIPEEQLLFPFDHFRMQNLTESWDLGRRFEALLCLEVAEHLNETCAGTLIDALVRHSDLIVFSAACPGQPGQNHVNCQWPSYWQRLFNAHGYACSDALRWNIWEEPDIEPWYRQNIFLARRTSEALSQETRIAPIVHPEIVKMMQDALTDDLFKVHVGQVIQGKMPPRWYLTLPFRAFWAKAGRWLK